MTVSTKPVIEALQVADEDGVVTVQALEAPAVVSREMPAPDSVMMRAGLVVPVSAPVIAVFGLNVNWAVVAVPLASEVSVIARDIVIAGNVPPVPASTVTMGLADASAVVADAMFVKAFCALVGVRNLVRVKTEAVFCG